MSEEQTTEKKQQLDETMGRMREASGRVTSTDPLVSFLYILLRDHLTPGKLEDILLAQGPHSGESVYSNGWLANYCKNIAERLKEPTPQFGISFDLTVWEKEGQVYATPKTKVFVDGKQMGFLDRVKLEASSKQALPTIEIDQKDYPADKIPTGFTSVAALRERFPWMNITLVPYAEPAAPPAPEPAATPEAPAAAPSADPETV